MSTSANTPGSSSSPTIVPSPSSVAETQTPQATLERQTKVGIGVGVGIWALISIGAFVFWFLRRRKRQRKQRQAPSAMFSEYDPQQVYFGERRSQGAGAAVLRQERLSTPQRPPMQPVAELSRERLWSFESADAGRERAWAPGLRSHPIATRNTMEDLGFLGARRIPSEVSSLSTGHSPIVAGGASPHLSSPSTESLADPDFPFRTRSNSPGDDDTRSISRLQPSVTESGISVKEIPRSAPSAMLPALSKLQGWLDENRRRSRAVNMQSRWSETENSSRPSRPTTYARSSHGTELRDALVNSKGNSKATL
jgi:hypothetical protein